MQRSLWVVSVTSLWLAVLSACGGGLYVGVGISDDDDDTSPAVSLVASPDPVRPAQTLRLLAAAADSSGIARVAFYRLDESGPVLLATDELSSFEWQEAAPSNGRTALRYFARATAVSGEQADSTTLVVAVQP